jgi:transposase-like protein
MKYAEQRIRGLVKQSRKIRGRRSGYGLRWPKDFQQRAVMLMTQGELSPETLSKHIGITAHTLRAWCGSLKAKPNSAGFRALKVVDGPRAKSPPKSPVKIFVTTSQGSEIQGLTADEVATLIRRGVL